MTMDEGGRSLPGQLYPTGPIRRAFHRLRHRQRSSRRQLGHTPKLTSISLQLYVHLMQWDRQIRGGSLSQEVLRLEGSLAHARDSIPLGKCPWRRHWQEKVSMWKHLRARERKGRNYINKQVFPQAPSPTMTSLRRISAMMATADERQMSVR